jgi:hypothetical protein
VAVTDNVVARAVALLRKALGDEAREAKYIETVPTRGYRFLGAPVAVGPTRLLVVLPFRPLVATERMESLELGMADSLIARMSGIRDLRVAPLRVTAWDG